MSILQLATELECTFAILFIARMAANLMEGFDEDNKRLSTVIAG
jgi:hypothetical protein|tara:strand:- start:1462 stop:1593 length:132 start_codon:yes stop_codon:yes gene_type:complete